MTGENVLVILNQKSYNNSTIERGVKIAEAYKSKLNVLFVMDANAEYNNTLKLALAETQVLSILNQVETYNIEEYDDVSDFYRIVNSFIDEQENEHVVFANLSDDEQNKVLGQAFVDELMRSKPDIELHVVSYKKEFPRKINEYEPASHAYLVESVEGLSLSHEKTDNVFVEGHFFQDRATDFDTGVFIVSEVSRSLDDIDVPVYKIVEKAAEKIELKE